MARLGGLGVEDDRSGIVVLSCSKDVRRLDITRIRVARDQNNLIGGDVQLVGGICQSYGSGQAITLHATSISTLIHSAQFLSYTFHTRA